MNKHKDVLLILAIILLFNVVHHMLVFAVPTYMYDHGGGETVIGALVGILFLGAVVFRLMWGKAAARSSSLHVLRWGLIINAAAPFFYIQFRGFAFLACLRLVQAAGLAGLVVGSQTLMVEYGGPGSQGLLLGGYSAMMGLGMALGPLFSAYLIEHFGYNGVFYSSVLVGAIAALAGFLISKQPRGQEENLKESPRLGRLLRNPKLAMICGSLLLATAPYGAIITSLRIQTESLDIPGAAVFFTVLALMYTIGGAAAGPLTDKKGPAAAVLPSFLILISGLAFLIFLAGRGTLITAAVLVGLGFGAVYSALLILVPDCSESRGDIPSNMALFNNSFDLGVVLGSSGLGWVARRSFSLLWAAVIILAGLGLLLFRKYSRSQYLNSRA